MFNAHLLFCLIRLFRYFLTQNNVNGCMDGWMDGYDALTRMPFFMFQWPVYFHIKFILCIICCCFCYAFSLWFFLLFICVRLPPCFFAVIICSIHVHCMQLDIQPLRISKSVSMKTFFFMNFWKNCSNF